MNNHSLNLPSGWEIKKLGEICEIRPSKKEAKDKLNETALVTFLPMEDLGILSKDIFPVKEKILKEVIGSYTYFAENDLLLAKITPCFENGKIGIARNLTNGIGFGSSEYIVFRSHGEVLQDYLFYFLSREAFREEGSQRMTGAVGHKRLAKDFIENYELPFPKSIAEQQRIVTILDEAFSAIAQAKNNAEQNLNNAKALFENYLQGIFENKGADWEEKTLGEACTLIMGQSPSGDTYNSDGIGVPLINGPVEFGKAPFSKTIKSKYTTDPTKYCKEGDLILCVRGSTTGRINIAGFNACIGRGVAAIRYPKNQYWINYFMLGSRKKSMI